MMALHLQADKNWTEHVVVDGKLVTGQNPQVNSTRPPDHDMCFKEPRDGSNLCNQVWLPNAPHLDETIYSEAYK